MRLARFRFGLLVGCAALLVTGCGSSALTNQPSVSPPTTSRAPVPAEPGGAVAGAVTKLHLISQDSCQTKPAEQVYPGCGRYLAELRSAASTLRGGAAELPNGAAVGQAATVVLDGAAAFERDGCGAGPYSAGPSAQPACVADLGRVRQGVVTLLRLTAPG